ncbi:MAG: hypothetical protein ACRDZZ_15430 [Ilumatobacteraceae bacterium]
MALTHGLDDLADGLVSLSLVGSLFFSVSLEASRSRILLYLLLTAAPLVVIAPWVGPMVERVRLGYRSIIVGSLLLRSVLALTLIGSLQTLGFYPVVFGILLSRKLYAIAKTAIVAQLVEDPRRLVTDSAHLSRTGTIAGGIGSAIGIAVLVTSSAGLLLAMATVGYVLSAVAALKIPIGWRNPDVDRIVVELETPAEVRVATWAVAVTRAAAGALTFLLAFALKRGGQDEWVFVAGIIAGGVGGFTATLVAPRLHHTLTEDRVLVMALLVPGVVTAIGVLTVGSFSTIVIAFSIGLGAGIASRAIDSMFGRYVSSFARGRVVARSEVRFQAAQVVGAAMPVLFAPGTRAGFGAVAGLMLAAGIIFASRSSISVRRVAGQLLLGSRRSSAHLALPSALLAEAERLARLGEIRMAIVVADSAMRVVHARHDVNVSLLADRRWHEVEATVQAVVDSDVVPEPTVVVAVLEAAQALIDSAITEPQAELERTAQRG